MSLLPSLPLYCPLLQRERKRWEFSESKYFSLKASFGYNVAAESGGKSHAGPIMLSKLHLLDAQKVAGEPDFDGGTGELRVLTKTAKGVAGESAAESIERLLTRGKY